MTTYSALFAECHKKPRTARRACEYAGPPLSQFRTSGDWMLRAGYGLDSAVLADWSTLAAPTSWKLLKSVQNVPSPAKNMRMDSG